MQDFRELSTWKKAHTIVLHIYKASESLPQSENFGLLLQLRRSATIIATRIAEGAGKDLPSEFSFDLQRARAAANELEYLLLLARDLSYFPQELHTVLTDEVIEVRRMISGLMKKLTSP
jgi:four helix bundle protein